MKTRFPFRIFLLFIFLFAFSSATVAQKKLQSLKFDEFEDSAKRPPYIYDEITLAQRTERFARQLKKMRGTKAYVIYYKARITENFHAYENSHRMDRIKNEIQLKTTLENEDVVIIDGGYREKKTIESWIVPKNAEPPAPRPTLHESETFACRSIYVYNDTPFTETETVNFSVSTYDYKGIDNYSLMWKVSAGEIVQGQGTDKIRVKLNDSAVKRITAFVEVSGLPYPCQKVFSATGEPQGKLHLIDSFGPIPNGETKARLDYFLSVMQSNSTAKGYIIVYGNRAKSGRDVEIRIALYRNHFNFRNVDLSRITIVRGGFREEISSELWLSFDDAEKPIPTPTVDEEFIVVPEPARKSRPRKR